MDRMCSLQKARPEELQAISALYPAERAAGLRILHESAVQQHRLHVLRANGSEEIAGAVVIGETGGASEPPALMLSGVVISPALPGALHALVDACELIGKLRGKERLLVACSPEEAEAFFLARGFTRIGQAGGSVFAERAIRQGCSCAG